MLDCWNASSLVTTDEDCDYSEMAQMGSPSHSSDSGCMDLFTAAAETSFDMDFKLDMDLLNGGDLAEDILSSELSSYLATGEIGDMSSLSRNPSTTTKFDHDYAAVWSPSDPEQDHEIKEEQTTELEVEQNSCQASNVDTFERLAERNVSQKSRKNAELARQNRLRKKRYVAGLENELSSCKDYNGKLVVQNKKLTKLTNQLKQRVDYLTRVLENESTLGAVLSAVTSVPGLDIRLPLRRKENETEQVTQEPASRGRRSSRLARGVSRNISSNIPQSTSPSGGICLHVSKNNVFVEFCEKCSAAAAVK